MIFTVPDTKCRADSSARPITSAKPGINTMMEDKITKRILMDASKQVQPEFNEQWILKPEVTIDYIDREKIFLPQKSMEKLELVDFTNKQIKKLFI